MEYARVILTICSLVLLTWQVSGYDADTVRRAIEDLQQNVRENQVGFGDNLERRAFCRARGKECSGVIPCCGTDQCFWREGYTMRKRGLCVECVIEGHKCQRQSQCCPDLQCDKGNALWIDGTCERYRRQGACYRDGQCVTKCQKRWYQATGQCT